MLSVDGNEQKPAANYLLSVILYLCVVTTLGQTTPEQCKHNKAKPSDFLTEDLANSANIRCGRSIHLMCGQVKGISSQDHRQDLNLT